MTVSRAHDLLAGAALAVGVCVVAALLWSQPVRWMPDGYFYRALVLRVLGADEQDALQQVFDGPLTAADRAEEADLLPYERKLSNPDWVRESAQFYERRWVVPLLAAPLDDWLGARGLRAVSLAGYVLLAPAALPPAPALVPAPPRAARRRSRSSSSRCAPGRRRR